MGASNGTTLKRRIRRAARQRLGMEDLRPGQEDAALSVLSGRDTLVVMPTGSGKSAIYQIAGYLLDGPTVVVSPLIALQRDQVEAIDSQDEGAAAQVNSALSTTDRREAFEKLDGGKLEFVFLAPEQLQNDETMAQIIAAKPSLLVVDEAHCISEWGHDFRPDYLRLGAAIETLGRPVILALTATAAPPVQSEIVERLNMRDPAILVRGFDRPNISFDVRPFEDEEEKFAALFAYVAEAAKPGIVYAATRKHAEEIAAQLVEAGCTAVAYHAGLTTTERNRVQSAFMDDEAEVIVATTAFGMGIDKPNVRFVAHADVSDSVDAYYQEIGRAGRDGEPAEAVLFYREKDLDLQRYFASGGQIDESKAERIAAIVAAHEDPLNPRELKEVTDLSDTKLVRTLNRLEEVGAIQLTPDGSVTSGDADIDPAEAAAAAVLAQGEHRQVQRSRVDMIRGYAETTGCRREYLLNYFGEDYSPPCNRCDNCLAGLATPHEPANEPFPRDSRVIHATWAEGQVIRYEGDKVVVLFDSVGYRTLAIDVVLSKGLLEVVDR